jgi:hypothetical protein
MRHVCCLGLALVKGHAATFQARARPLLVYILRRGKIYHPSQDLAGEHETQHRDRDIMA